MCNRQNANRKIIGIVAGYKARLSLMLPLSKAIVLL
jgi:hypothetical protein